MTGPSLLGDSRASQVLRIVTLVLVALVLGGVLMFGRSLGELNKDDKLIDRGQQATNCLGDRQDFIDDWRAIAGIAAADAQEEFLLQVRAVEQGERVQLAQGLAATRVQRDAQRNIRLLVREKREIRAQHLELIAEGDPDAEFVCADIDPDLTPPPIEDS